jgi:hypothetical protein
MKRDDDTQLCAKSFSLLSMISGSMLFIFVGKNKVLTLKKPIWLQQFPKTVSYPSGNNPSPHCLYTNPAMVFSDQQEIQILCDA